MYWRLLPARLPHKEITRGLSFFQDLDCREYQYGVYWTKLPEFRNQRAGATDSCCFSPSKLLSEGGYVGFFLRNFSAGDLST